LRAVVHSGTLAARIDASASEKIVIRQIAAVALVTVLFACIASADTITYNKQGPTGREQARLDKVTVTTWSAAKVEYRTEEGRPGTLASADVVTINRDAPGMSDQLTKAIGLAGSDPQAAKAALGRVAASGNALDKEEASYWIARIAVNEASTGEGAAGAAITECQNYLKSYKSGYFAREVYRSLGEVQQRAKRAADARNTYKAMAGADNALAREGYQLLGQLEAAEAKWQDAISAFDQAKTRARSDGYKAGEYLAQAWQGAVTAKNNDPNGAKTLLEGVTSGEAFEDATTFDDENALAVAYPALGDVLFAKEDFAKAYDAYIKAAYYAWWTAGTGEGRSIGGAYKCARKLESGDEKWKKRKDKLRTALALGFPQELQRAEKD
jgi:tetratricopeptide (TPR) repeat protein